jgi:L-Lysine epsilon oxidase N-terminal/L-lysine epsilon oxidase C-terminal domain
MIYKIFPPIGIARIGNSPDEFFVGPETPGSLGIEFRADGTEVPVERFKDAAFRVKRQAARFRVFEFDNAGGAGRPAVLPTGAMVRWTVKLANRKDAVIRANEPMTERPGQPPPPFPQLDPGRANRAIAAEGTAPNFNAPPVTLRGTYLTGSPLQESVLLGELKTDRDGHLLVFGGLGVSRSPEGKPIGNEVLNGEAGGGFYNNRGWYDDVGDGPVTAEILIPGQAPVAVASAWVIVAPPDFAPATAPLVTLHDVIVQVAIDRGQVTLPAKPSFSRDIWPMLVRAAGLKWVNRRGSGSGPSFWDAFSTDWAALSDTAQTGPNAELRRRHAKLLRDIQPRRALANFSLRQWQRDYVAAWERGDFESDFNGTVPDAGVLSPEHLTRTALDATAGQGFFPGIEAGILVMNPALYSAPFRIAANVQPGALTALMALPWQADFLKCDTNWWPSQRPDSAAQMSDSTTFRPWARPIDESDQAHRDLVSHVNQLGMLLPRRANGQDVVVEVDRDPALDES